MMTSIKTMTLQARTTAVLLALMVVLLITPDSAFAGGGGSEFDDIWNTLELWVQGTLGKIVAATMILVGVIAGVARQSLIAFAIGIGGGIGLYNTPVIIENIVSATLNQTPEATLMLMTLSNGLGA